MHGIYARASFFISGFLICQCPCKLCDFCDISCVKLDIPNMIH